MSVALAGSDHSRFDGTPALGRGRDVLSTGLSLLLHAGLLIGISLLTWPHAPPPETVAVTVEMVAALPEPAAPAVTEAQPPAPPVKAKPEVPAVPVAPPPKPHPVVARHSPPPPAVAAAPTAPASDVSPTPVAPPANTPTVTAEQPPPIAPAAPAVSPAAYLADIQSKVAAHLRYPPQALRRGEQGVVHVHLTLSRSGDLLAASTDDEATPRLREAALQAVRDCTPFPPLPMEPSTQQAMLVVPVVFTIQ